MNRSLIVFNVGMVLIVMLNCWVHEFAHESISVNHGCIDYNTKLTSFICNEYKEGITLKIRLQEEYLHSLNDIKQYNEDKYIFMFWLGVNIFIYRRKDK